MTIQVQAPRIRSNETPREILAADFKSLGGELPIQGGWGYSREDAVIINKDDPVVEKGLPFDGVSIEYIFVEKRIYEELIIFRPENKRYSGIRWNLIKQQLTSHNDKSYDVLYFAVTAIPHSDWEALKSEWESNNGFQSSKAKLKLHMEKQDSKIILYQTEYWFDITSFYGRH